MNFDSQSQGHDVNFSSISGERITEERKRLGLNQAAAADACGVSREMWSKYERGKAVMGTEVLAGFVSAGADALYILTGQRSQPVAAPPLKPDEAALLDNYRHCSQEGQAAVAQVALVAAAKPGKVTGKRAG